MKEIVHTNAAPEAIGPYSQGTVWGQWVFTSGQIPVDPDTAEIVAGGINEQTRRVMENLVAVLKAAGSSPAMVMKTTCFLADMADFAAFNAVYAEYFNENPPARACVAVRTLPKNVLVEVEAIAIRT